MGRRLFQQWVVDSYVKIEKDRINYCRNHQKQLRAESYQGLIDYMRKRNETNQQNGINIECPGKIFILPSTFVNSPRYMIQQYQDAMCIVRKYGTPDLFITMTCNPNWDEIVENLLPGQTAADRPDLVARVFSLKVKHLINVIVKQKHFGTVLAYVYVIEYQKRGLPHVHLLVTLDRDSKITTPTDVDKYISAEIPDLDDNETLHNIVMKNMIHGPCGDWCLFDGKCSKKYPKSYTEETTMDENGYSRYRRMNTGRQYTKSHDYKVDNRHVVPYNKELLLMLNCHINVEIVASIKAVKYLFKYIYKGHDCASVDILNPETERVIDHDEIREFIEGRYIGPVEACWRILNKELQQKSHAFIRLPVHLPNQHTVTIDESGTDDVINKALEKQTMLIDYFALNARDEEARNFSYAEIPSHYVFKKSSNDSNVHSWNNRKKQLNVIGRMYSISPNQTELFHLRLLLIHTKGATSFDDLKTVNGITHQTFVETCLALGLIEDDNEWTRALTGAESWMMPQQLRRLFVRILIYCQPIYPHLLWDTFKISMSQDFSRNFEQNIANQKAYAQISRLLISEGSNLEQYPTMEQLIELGNDEDDSPSYEEHTNIGKLQYEKLNKTQKEIVDIIYDAVLNKENLNNKPTCFYIDGPGGSGKTFIYTTLYHMLKGEQKNISTVAFTGIEATLLPEGKTVHKTFGMPVPLYFDSSSNIKKNSKVYEFLKNIDLFIWDEAPMAPRHALELVHRTLCDILNNNLPFGGKIIVLGGDFRQLLPIKLHATRTELVNLSI
ncbi:uncharacterized protein LOC123269633 [Cotesia glomerata]|uniref:uncharacterized protein LOC123269633 n=1 Tax=Cotesia glomerata TaxID=32391 RepID=UPI001D03141B|nr:uncharacterized protein LOC123269633 [Cotesia glomerata]